MVWVSSATNTRFQQRNLKGIAGCPSLTSMGSHSALLPSGPATNGQVRMTDRHADMASIVNIFQRGQYCHIQTIHLRLSPGSDSRPAQKNLFVRQTLTLGWKIEAVCPGVHLWKSRFSSLPGFLPWAFSLLHNEADSERVSPTDRCS